MSNDAILSALKPAFTSGMSIPTLAQLLVDGGDSRITLDTYGVNKYGCTVEPQSTQDSSFAFGSATASTISQRGFAAANRVYQQIVEAYRDKKEYSLYSLYEQEMQSLRQELKQLCQTGDAVDVAFAASGTDLHLIVSQLFSGASSSPSMIVMVEAGETGSSVPAALQGLHFSDCAALGEPVSPGQQVGQFGVSELVNIALREADGKPRAAGDIDREIEALVTQACHHNKRVLLVLADVTKTGMIGPSVQCALALRNQFPDQLEVLVDACQFRLTNATLNAYLDQQFLVAVTGSKFISGPSFSGALFFPPEAAIRYRQQTAPAGLYAYSSRADWPASWTGMDGLQKKANVGLLVRWVAAMAELRAFRSLPDDAINQFVQAFRRAVLTYFDAHSGLTLLPVPVPDRQVLATTPGWDQWPTIFPFVLHHASGEPLSRDQTMLVYRRLQNEKRMQVGQPVTCGVCQQIPVSALRLCLSARLITAALSDVTDIRSGGNKADEIIAKAMEVLDAARQLSLLRDS
ncbi:hypothetical protein Undi14_13660 [Undibacterium sp. 14-3-2]|uniref:hypothetical protein n=1 Tax=Undibacterium sp. 14-3-2 TaxID=2800129 RepID=UPI001904AA56|nr:hypothetical protein [Undibacterium sp. 14-3-2]MBK1891084.1 hypothetical protein [Undibacterium sp. 14-3-2]